MSEGKPLTVFDHKVCWKCDGRKIIEGYRHIHNGVCFACGGVGYKLTKHGKADHARWRAAVDAIALRTVADVQVGDHVKGRSDNRYAKVISVEQASDFHGETNGVAWTQKAITLKYNRKVIDLALASCPSLPRDMVYHDGMTTNATAEIYIHPDSPLRNPYLSDCEWAAPRMPKAADFVTAVKTRKTKVGA